MTEAMFDRRRGRYGTIGRHSVLKSNRVIKDVSIGECAYVKGSNKLKNLSILSSERERSQIGEGVELVNGIVGYGCRVFYGCKAVRFVMGANSASNTGLGSSTPCSATTRPSPAARCSTISSSRPTSSTTTRAFSWRAS